MNSTITSKTEDGKHNYGFEVLGSTLKILSSEIHYAGWNSDPMEGYGIVMLWARANIQDSNISHNYAGLTLYEVSQPMTIRNNTISWNQRNGITAIESNVNLTGNKVFYNGLIMDLNWGPFAGHGITLANSTTGVVCDNDLYENFWDGLFVYYSSDLTINGNRILRNRNEGTEFFASYNVSFEENNASETVLYSGLTLWYSDYNTIRNNTFFGNGYSGMYMYASAYNDVRNNTAIGNQYQGLSLRYADYNTIENNTFFGNGNNGLYTYRSWYNDVLNNTATGSLRYHGFSIEESNNNNLIGNVAQSVYRYGVWMGSSRMNTLIGNNLSSNGWGGVYIFGEFGNSLLLNDIYDNQGEGVRIDASSSNHLYGNNISKNIIGVLAYQSNDNTIIWNNFTSNQLQAADDFGINYWDAGYPLGGNYWDDYGGSDFFLGPNQDQPGSDGIGDVPYVIDSDSQDNYPLMSPFDPTLPGPPTNVTATLSGDKLANVTMRWNLSWNDRAGGNVANYAIYYGRDYNPNGTDYTFLSEIPAGNSSYVHVDGGYGDPNSYYYIVVANNTIGKTTKGGNQAGKFTRNLKTGLNLVSYPLILEDKDLESVLKTVNFTEVWHYDAHSVDSKWVSYSEKKSYSTFPELDHRKAYWINVSEESNFTVAGMVPLRSYIDLKSGWNLIGYPSPINRTSAQALGGVPVTEIEGFEGTASPYFLKRIGLNDELIPGYGYWIRVDSDSTWIVDNL